MKTIQTKQSLLSVISASLCILFLGISPAASQAGSIDNQIDDYFVQLREAFDEVSSNSAVSTTSLSRTDRYFVNALRKHQIFYSLIRTNSKGVVTNKVIRGQTPERNFKNIAYQRWFKQVQQTAREYFGFLKEDTGRYYLFWSKPVFKTRRSGSQTFVGAIAVKVDIWDAIHDFSQSVNVPFLVSLNNVSLYDHKWQKPQEFETKQLSVPGIENISVSFVSSGTPAAAATAQQAPDTAQTAKASEATKAEVKNDSINDPQAAMSSKGVLTIVGIIAALLILGIVVGVRIFMSIRHKALMRKIDHDNSLL